jgi:putative transcriptional regulator
MAFPYESRVRERRVRLGLSQDELARQVGVSRQTIANIEQNVNEPRVTIAIALALALGVAVHELFRRKR